jgi:hypothetical protein
MIRLIFSISGGFWAYISKISNNKRNSKENLFLLYNIKHQKGEYGWLIRNILFNLRIINLISYVETGHYRL